MKPAWNELNKPLRQVAQTLNLPHETLVEGETLDAFNIRVEELATIDAVPLSKDELNALHAVFGDALHFEIRLGNLSVLNLSGVIDDAALESFHQKVRQSPTLLLDWHVDKARSLEKWNVAHPNAHVYIFFFVEALERALRASPVDLEQTLFSPTKEERKVILIAPEYVSALDGEYLAILGQAAVDIWESFVPTRMPQNSLVPLMREQAVRALNWNYFELGRLTPLHLMTSTPRGVFPLTTEDPINNALAEGLVNLSIIYTADQTTGPKPKAPTKTWRARYAEGATQAHVAFGVNGELARALQGTELKPMQAADALGDLTLWAFSSERDRELKSSDRLAVLQGVTARLLPSDDPGVNYQTLARSALHLTNDVTLAWQTFTADKLEVYFSRVQQVEQAVEELVKQIDGQIGDLTKSLTDSMLAAVGVIVGTFIAAVFESKFNPTIFRLGLGLYALYLLLFPGVIGLSALWEKFQDASSAFEKRKTELGKLLPRDQVESIVGIRVDSKKRSFKRWFRITILVFAIVIVLLILGAIAVPTWIVASAAGTPTLTPTMPAPTGTPTP